MRVIFHTRVAASPAVLQLKTVFISCFCKIFSLLYDLEIFVPRFLFKIVAPPVATLLPCLWPPVLLGSFSLCPSPLFWPPFQLPALFFCGDCSHIFLDIHACRRTYFFHPNSSLFSRFVFFWHCCCFLGKLQRNGLIKVSAPPSTLLTQLHPPFPDLSSSSSELQSIDSKSFGSSPRKFQALKKQFSHPLNLNSPSILNTSITQLVSVSCPSARQIQQVRGRSSIC